MMKHVLINLIIFICILESRSQPNPELQRLVLQQSMQKFALTPAQSRMQAIIREQLQQLMKNKPTNNSVSSSTKDKNQINLKGSNANTEQVIEPKVLRNAFKAAQAKVREILKQRQINSGKPVVTLGGSPLPNINDVSQKATSQQLQQGQTSGKTQFGTQLEQSILPKQPGNVPDLLGTKLEQQLPQKPLQSLNQDRNQLDNRIFAHQTILPSGQQESRRRKKERRTKRPLQRLVPTQKLPGIDVAFQETGIQSPSYSSLDQLMKLVHILLSIQLQQLTAPGPRNNILDFCGSLSNIMVCEMDMFCCFDMF